MAGFQAGCIRSSDDYRKIANPAHCKTEINAVTGQRTAVNHHGRIKMEKTESQKSEKFSLKKEQKE
jgi:hypothetical protein